MRRLSFVLIVVAFLVLSGGRLAQGWYADFLYADASGNASYEAMVINPEAVHDSATDTTYIVFQGPGLDPYITAYDHGRGVWLPTYRVGNNTLYEDTHGGPALVIDASGYLFVFYGGHNSNLRYARSNAPHAINSWTSDLTIRLEGEASALRATYPQPWAMPDGGIELFYRNHGSSSEDPRSLDWEIARTSDGTTWTAAESVADAAPESTQWYANATHGASGVLHVGLVLRDSEASASDRFVRRDAFYIRRDADGIWTNADGDPLGDDRSFATMDAMARIADSGDRYTNQVVVREAPDGSPAVLYLEGGKDASASCTWHYKRWSETGWTEAHVTQTDNLFDAADLAFDSTGAAHAYLVTGGLADDQALPEEAASAARGGNVEHWVSDNGVDGWRRAEVVRASTNASSRYNNPQIVSSSDATRDGVLFCEWNNDMSSYIHKLFLYTNGSFVQREFNPDIRRLAGINRIETAVKISREAFPYGCDAVVIASARDYPDALCGVPLAQSYRAPVLLCDSVSVSSYLENELRRLRPGVVILLGGEMSLSADVSSRLAQILPQASVNRIAGADRYETSGKIAEALFARRGRPDQVVVASGAGFADALTSSAFAARKGWPVLLSRPGSLPAVTESMITTLAPSRVIMIGGTSALAPTVQEACAALAPSVVRWWGADRYATAERVAQESVAMGHRLERPVIASGEVFADAVPGGLLAARFNSVIILTRHDYMPPPSSRVLLQATRVTDAYVLGGVNAIEPGVENSVASILHTVEAE